jgi:hypothetical protein
MKSFYRALAALALIFGVVSTAQATYCLHEKIFFRSDEINGGCNHPLNIFSNQASHNFNLNQQTNQVLHATPGAIMASVDDQMEKLTVTVSPKESGNVKVSSLIPQTFPITAGQRFNSGVFVRLDGKRYFLVLLMKNPGQVSGPGAILFVNENDGTLYPKMAFIDAQDKTDLDINKARLYTDPADIAFTIEKHVEPIAQKNSYALVFNQVNGMFLAATDQSVEGGSLLSRPMNFQVQPGATILWRAVRIQIISVSPNDIAYKVIGLIGE